MKFYLKLLDSSSESQANKLFICLAILNNKEGPTLKDEVTRSVNAVLLPLVSLPEVETWVESAEILSGRYNHYSCIFF